MLLQVMSRVISAKNWLSNDVSEEILWRHVATVNANDDVYDPQLDDRISANIIASFLLNVVA